MKVLHLGLGHFHKAHQAWYFEKLAQKTGEKWEITAFSMRSAENARALAKSNYRYQVIQVENTGDTADLVSSITKTGFLLEDVSLLEDLAQDPKLEIVTLTVTEKGYCFNADHELDRSHSDIQYDLRTPFQPRSAIGALALILRTRSQIGLPLTVLSCDNLSDNGARLEKAVRSFMGHEYPTYKLTFPNSVVDRIVPASATHDCVRTEAFTQWTVEDKFAGRRPALDKVGVQFVRDVRPYELMKLRLLNAGHSFLAYWGLLKGHEFVHQVVRDPRGRELLRQMWLKEVIPLLEVSEELNPRSYCENLLSRFDNPNLPHRLSQIATDGSIKLTQRIVPSLKTAWQQRAPCEVLKLALSSWAKALRELPPDLFADPVRKQSQLDDATLGAALFGSDFTVTVDRRLSF